MKPIPHAQKKLMLKYFEVLGEELSRALEEPTAETSFIETVSVRVYEQVVAIAAGIPDVSAPSMQQIRKNLEAVLDPSFFGGKNSDPIRAVQTLKQELREQPEYTRPKSGVWNRDQRPRRSKTP